MESSRRTSTIVAALVVGSVVFVPRTARADLFGAPSPAPGGGQQICASGGLLCLSAPAIESPPGGGVVIRGAPTLTVSPSGASPISLQLGEAEVTVTPTGLRFMGAAAMQGFGPLTGWEFAGPRGDLAVGLGSSPAFDGYENNGDPAGFPIGDTRVTKEDAWLYLYISYGATFSVNAPGGAVSIRHELASGNTLLIGINPSAPQNFVFYLGGGFTAPLTYQIVGEGYVLIQNGARVSALAPLEVYREFPGERTATGTLTPSLLVGGTAQLGSPSVPISGRVRFGLQLDPANLNNTRGRVDASLTLDLGQYPPFSDVSLTEASVFANQENTLIKAANLPSSIFSGTPLEDFDVGTGGYRFDGYIPYRASPVIQFRAQTATLGGLRFGTFKVAFFDGGTVSVRGNLDVFGARYDMVGSITTGNNPQLRLTNTGGLVLFGVPIAQGQLEVLVNRNDASLHVSGNVTLQGVRFTLDRTFSAAELAQQAGRGITLPPVAFSQTLTVPVAGRDAGAQLGGSVTATLAVPPSVLASGNVSISAPALDVTIPRTCTPGACTGPVCTPGACTGGQCTPGACTPRRCTPGACTGGDCTPRTCRGYGPARVCTPRVCSPRVCAPEVCTPAACAPEVCTPRVCAPEVCTPRTCAPEVCTPAVTTRTPAWSESARFDNVTVSAGSFGINIPRVGARSASPSYTPAPSAPAPRAERAVSSPAQGPIPARPSPITGPRVALTRAPTQPTGPLTQPGPTTNPETLPTRQQPVQEPVTQPGQPAPATQDLAGSGALPQLSGQPPMRMTNAWRGAGICLEAIDRGNGLAPVLVPCGGSTGQLWMTGAWPNGAVALVVSMGGVPRCLEVVDGSDRMAVRACSGRPPQQWRLRAEGGAVQLSIDAGGSTRCVDVVNDGRNDQLRIADCGGYSGQFWSMPQVATGPVERVTPDVLTRELPPQPPASPAPPASGPTTTLTNDWRGAGVCLESARDQQAILDACNAAPSQQWGLVSTEGGAVRLTPSGGAGVCLDVADGSASVTVLPCSGRPGQRWHPVPLGNGRFRLTNDLGGPNRCLDVVNDGVNNRVQLAPCGNYSGQAWSMTVSP